MTNMRWLDYIEENKMDGLFFYNPDTKHLLAVWEGTGQNLLPEDEEAGFVDYWMVDEYGREGNVDGMQIMCTSVIRENNKSINDICSAVNEAYRSIGDKPLWYYIIDPTIGTKIETACASMDEARLDKVRAQIAYEKAQKEFDEIITTELAKGETK
jgi:hypothetical protein